VVANQSIEEIQRNRRQNDISKNQHLDQSHDDTYPASSSRSVPPPAVESALTQIIETSQEVRGRNVILDHLDRRQKQSRSGTSTTSTSRITMDPREDRPPDYYDESPMRPCPTAPAILITIAGVSEEEPHLPSGHTSAAILSVDFPRRGPANEVLNPNRRRMVSDDQPSRIRRVGRRAVRNRKRVSTNIT